MKTDQVNKGVSDLEDFQISSIISSIKDVTKYEMDTDTNFKVISKSALNDYESILSSVKDRKHVEDAVSCNYQNFPYRGNKINSISSQKKLRLICTTINSTSKV